MQLKLSGKTLALDAPVVMGILNVTPDSFSDGGKFVDPALAVEHAVQMANEGAAIIDVGGESTRPGSSPVSVSQEIDRVVPVIEKICAAIDTPVSVDTSKPEVMRAAVAAGAAMINDVYALRTPNAMQVAAGLNVPICLMHMLGEPRSMQDAPVYTNVVAEIAAFLEARAAEALATGIPRENIVIDPGFGFGKTLAHNLLLLGSLREFASLGYALLVGVSRKSMIGGVLDRSTGNRLAGSIAAAVIAVRQGANIIRVHDVQATRDALKMIEAVDKEILTNPR